MRTALTIFSSMPGLIYGTRMTARSVIRDADGTTRRTLIHVFSVGWTGVVLSLKYLMTRTALNAPNMACLSQMSHGLIPVAALRRTSTLLWGGLQHTCLEALSLNICVLTGKRSEGVSTGP